MIEPLVSICIPTYNGAAYISESMNSAINQTYSNLEIVVSDDASKDDTIKIIEFYKEKTNIPILIYHHSPSGIGANWNHCVKKANGAYIKFLFQDDVLYPGCINKMVEVFNQNPHLGLVACKRDFIIEGKENKTIKNWIKKYGNLQCQFEIKEPITYLDNTFFKRKDFLSLPANKIGEPSSIMFKKKFINKVGYFDGSLKQILDYVFYYRILKHSPIAIINETLVSFRIHEAQATNVNRNKPIADYDIYKKILYKEFLWLLHPIHKKKLALKFSYKAKLKLKLKRVLKKIHS